MQSERLILVAALTLVVIAAVLVINLPQRTMPVDRFGQQVAGTVK